MGAPKEGDRSVGGRSGKPTVFTDGKWVYADGSATPEPTAPEPTAPEPEPRKRHGELVEDAGSTWRNVKETAGEVGQGIKDAAIGVGTGIARGWDDEIAGAAGVDDYQATKDESRARSAKLADRVGGSFPSANTMGEVAGTLVGPTTGPTTGLVKGFAANPIVQGALYGAGEANEDRVTGGAFGAGAGVVGGLASKAVKSGARVLSGQSARVGRLAADNARVKSAGLNPAAIDQAPGGIPNQAAVQRKYKIGTGILSSGASQEDQVRRAIAGVESERAAIRKAASSGRATGADVGWNIIRQAQEQVPDGVASQYQRGLFRKANDIAARTRPLTLEDLDKGRRHYSPDNWGNSANTADKNLATAYSDASESLLDNFVEPGAGARYRGLGRDEAALIRAKEGLLGAGDNKISRPVPHNKVDAANRLIPRGIWTSVAASAREGAAWGLEGIRKGTNAIRPGKGPVDEGALQAGYGAAEQLGRSTGGVTAGRTFAPDPYEYYREYMSNPDYRHTEK